MLIHDGKTPDALEKTITNHPRLTNKSSSIDDLYEKNGLSVGIREKLLSDLISFAIFIKQYEMHTVLIEAMKSNEITFQDIHDNSCTIFKLNSNRLCFIRYSSNLSTSLDLLQTNRSSL